MTRQDDNLHVLSIFHYVVAALGALFSLFPVIHIVMGAMILNGRFGEAAKPPEGDAAGWIFILLGSVLLVVGLTFSALYAYAGRSLARREHYTYCLVMAGVGCMFVPFGTVLGVFTIIELQKESVRQLFGRA